jgi:hypothetical protein
MTCFVSSEIAICVSSLGELLLNHVAREGAIAAVSLSKPVVA